MSASVADRRASTACLAAPWHGMPPRLKILYITTRQRTGGWLAEALAADSAMVVELEEVVGTAAGLGRLRDEVFDAVLVSHEPGELDALDLIEGYRAGGAEEPIVVLGTQSEQEVAVLCYEVGADGYVCVHTTTTRNLIWVVARAVQRHVYVRENQHFRQSEQTRIQREHDESRRLLWEQRALIEEPFDHESEADRLRLQLPLPPELIDHYRELLRVYVIMGSGNLAPELQQLAVLLVTGGLTARQVLQLHVQVLEELLHGLGARSTRHVTTRADLLILEVMTYLADNYRSRYQHQVHPPVQRLLPGFGEPRIVE